MRPRALVAVVAFAAVVVTIIAILAVVVAAALGGFLLDLLVEGLAAAPACLGEQFELLKDLARREGVEVPGED